MDYFVTFSIISLVIEVSDILIKLITADYPYSLEALNSLYLAIINPPIVKAPAA